MYRKSLLILAIAAACASVQAQPAPSSPAKKELVARILKIQQPAIDKMARGLVGITERFVSPENLPLVMLWLVFLLTLCLTEVLSNNATAVMMIPIVVTLAKELGVDSRPFVIAVAVSASAAFALPMGYQTHMMIYGPGGYKFTDFLRVGIPLNAICWVVSCLVIPVVWPF